MADDVCRIGMMMSRYKSGKLPKPLKILPTVPHWEEILEVTSTLPTTLGLMAEIEL